MKHSDVDELFIRRFIIHELESSLNDGEVIDTLFVAEGKTETSVVS